MKRYHALLFSCLIANCLHSQTIDDNVIISSCEDSYIFKEEYGIPVVQNTETTEYEASRMGTDIQPYTYYGDFISLDKANAKGLFAPKAIHQNATPENVFFDDLRVCFFNLRLDRQGKKTSVEFGRTFHDLHYFTTIYFPKEYFIREKRVTVTIPRSLSRFHLIEKNFTAGITCEKAVNRQGDSIFIYTMKALPGSKKEDHMPGNSYVYPHLLVVGLFDGVQDMYHWLNGLAQVDCTLPGRKEALLDEITGGCSTEEEKIRRTYAWVQKNIRYIAFEQGIAGHQPDRPAEVLRKRYGDCKGMALLLKTLLKAQNMDARLAYIGTDKIAHSPAEVPTLTSINHMICVLFHQEKTHYLDATYEYIPLDVIPEGIQGRQALIENGDSCLLQTLPVLDCSFSTDSLHYAYRLATDGEVKSLEGEVTRIWSGEMKEFFLTLYHQIGKEQQNNLLSNLLTDKALHCRATDIRWKEQRPEVTQAILTGKVSNIGAIQSADGKLYIEMNPHNGLFNQPVDTTRRKQDYLLPFHCRTVSDVSLMLPEGCTAGYIPEGIRLESEQGVLSCSYILKEQEIIFRKVMEIRNKRIPRSKIPDWNALLLQWEEACDEQVIINQ